MRNNLKAVCAVAVAMCLALAAAGCSSGPQDRIVGKWEAGPAGAKLTAEFAQDGTATLTMLGQPMRGTYKLAGDELAWTVGGQTTKYKVKVTATELELISDGKTVTYKKV